jgi:hypothetical protein
MPDCGKIAKLFGGEDLNRKDTDGCKALTAKLAQLEARIEFVHVRHGPGTVKMAFLAANGLPRVHQVCLSCRACLSSLC